MREEKSDELKTLENVSVLEFSALAEDGKTAKVLDHDLGEGVEVQMPVEMIDTSKVDTDKLTAVVYAEEGSGKGTWQAVGGKYDPYDKTFKFKRKSFSMYTIMQMNKSFGDLAKYDWAKRDIEIMASKGIVTGKTSSEYDPSANVTRAEFTALVVRTLGLLDNKAKVYFKDVKSSDWYYTAVASAYNEGIVKGKDAQHFRPNDPITRQEIMQVVANAMEKALGMTKPGQYQADKTINAFQDKNDIAGWAKQAVAFSISEGIVKGKTAVTIKPGDYATRAETAVIAKRLYDLL